MAEKLKPLRSEVARKIIVLYLRNKIPFQLGKTYKNFKEVAEVLGIEPKKGKAGELEKKNIFKYLVFLKKGHRLTYVGTTNELDKRKRSELVQLCSDPKSNESSTRKRTINDTTYYIINHIFCKTQEEETYEVTEKELLYDLGLMYKRDGTAKSDICTFATHEYRKLTDTKKNVTIGATMYMDAYHDTFTKLLAYYCRKDKETPLTKSVDVYQKYKVLLRNEETGETIWENALLDDVFHIQNCIKYAQNSLTFSQGTMYKNSKTFFERLQKAFQKPSELHSSDGGKWCYEAFKKVYQFVSRPDVPYLPYKPRSKDYNEQNVGHMITNKLVSNFVKEWQKRETININNKREKGYSLKPIPYENPLVGYSLLCYFHSPSKPEMDSLLEGNSEKIKCYSEIIFNGTLDDDTDIHKELLEILNNKAKNPR